MGYRSRKMLTESVVKVKRMNLLPTEYSYRENIYALLLTVAYGVHPDIAMQSLGVLPRQTPKRILTVQDVEDMIIMRDKEGLRLKEIGKYYNMSVDCVNKRIARHKKKLNKQKGLVS